jgi:hypothetical protein
MIKNIFTPLQVKNKPHDGESEHAFILGSMGCTVADNYCSLHSWRGLVQEDKRTVFAYTHGLFIT